MPSPIRTVLEEPDLGLQPDVQEAAMEGGDVQMADVPPQEEYSESDRARLGTHMQGRNRYPWV